MKKQKWEEAERSREQEQRSEKRERLRRKKMQACENVGKRRFIVFCPIICGYRGSKSRLAKGAGGDASGQMRDDKLQALVLRSAGRSDVVLCGRRKGLCTLSKVSK